MENQVKLKQSSSLKTLNIDPELVTTSYNFCTYGTQSISSTLQSVRFSVPLLKGVFL